MATLAVNASGADLDANMRNYNYPFSPDAVLGFIKGWNTWQYVVAVLIAVVLYDQGKNVALKPIGCSVH